MIGISQRRFSKSCRRQYLKNAPRGGTTSPLLRTQFAINLEYIISTVVFSMLDKMLLTSVTNGIIIKITVENTHIMKIVCKNICIITVSCYRDFLNRVSVTFIHKTDPSNPLVREQHWRHVLQTNCTSWSEYSRWCLVYNLLQFCIFTELIVNLYTDINYGQPFC